MNEILAIAISVLTIFAMIVGAIRWLLSVADGARTYFEIEFLGYVS